MSVAVLTLAISAGLSMNVHAVTYEGSNEIRSVVSTHTVNKICSITLIDGTDSKIGWTDVVLADNDKVQVRVESNFPAIHKLKVADEWADERVYNQITGNDATPPNLIDDHYVWKVRNVSYSKDFLIENDQFTEVSTKTSGQQMIHMYPEMNRASEGLTAATYEVSTTINYYCSE